MIKKIFALFRRRPAADPVRLQADLDRTRAELADALAELRRLRPLADDGERLRAELIRQTVVADVWLRGPEGAIIQARILEGASIKNLVELLLHFEGQAAKMAGRN